MISFKRYLREATAEALPSPNLDAPNIDVKAVVWRGLQAAARRLVNTPLAPMWSRVPMPQAPSNLQTVLRHYVSRLPNRVPYEKFRRGAVAYVLDVEPIAAPDAPLDKRRGRRGPPPSFDRAVIVEPVTGAVLVVPSIRNPQVYHYFPSTKILQALTVAMELPSSRRGQRSRWDQ